MHRRSFLTTTAAALAACGRKPAPTFAGHAFVANRSGRAIAAVDLSALAAVRHIRLDAEPHTLATHRSRPTLYVSTPATSTLHEIDTGRLETGRKLRLPSPATQLAFQPGGAALWALLPESRQLLRISPEKMAVEARIALPHAAASFDLAPETWAAVSLGDRGQAALIHRDTAKLDRTIDLGGTTGQLRFRKDNRYLIAADLSNRAAIFYDMSSHRVAVRVPLLLRPDNLCFKPDGGQLFITGEGMDAVVTLYPYQTEVGATTLAGRAPGVMAASYLPDYLFVANPIENTVTILNVATQRAMAATQVGSEPCHISVTPNQEYAIVLNRQSGDLSMIHIPTLSARRNKAAALFTQVPVGSEPVDAVLRAV